MAGQDLCCNGALYRSRTHRSRLPALLARMQQLAVFSFGHARRVREIIMPCVRGIQFSAMFGDWGNLMSQKSSAYRLAIIARSNLRVDNVLRQCGVRMETRIWPR